MQFSIGIVRVSYIIGTIIHRVLKLNYNFSNNNFSIKKLLLDLISFLVIFFIIYFIIDFFYNLIL